MQFLKTKISSIIKKSIEWEYRQTLNKKLDNPNVELGQYVMFDDNFDLEFLGEDFSLQLGTRVIFKKYCGIIVCNGAKLVIKENVFFNKFCSINCLGNITIGSNTIFGEGVKLYDHNHSYQYKENQLEIARNDYSIGSINIGNNCWIGSNVTILKNVVIGDNVIIGADCLIYKSIPANTVVKNSQQLIGKEVGILPVS